MTIIRCEYDGVIYDLDVLEETPIRLDISAIENDAIGEVFGAASQQFILPGSKKNNRFFKHAYKVGADNVPGLNESVTAWLISESDTLLEGSLYLDGVVKTKNEGVNYEVTIVNNIITFNELIKTTRVKDLAWSNYNHSLSMINITASWNDDLFGGDVFYPLVDFGRDGSETTGSLPNIAWNPADDNTAGFINSTITPIKANQFSPAIRVKTVLDKVFAAGNFTYETSLTDLFNSTYILPRQVETLGVKGSGFSDFGFIASKNSDQLISGNNTYVKITNPIEVYDPTNGYDTGSSVYTIPSSGTYSFSGSIFYGLSPEDPSPLLKVRVRDTTNNITIGSKFFEATELTGSFEFETTATYLAKNTTIELQGAYQQGGGEGLIEIAFESGSGFKTKETPLNWETGIVNVGEQFDPQLKCVDILRGIIQKFNLVFEPDYTKNRVIKIETYNKWVSLGDRKDWTEKIQQAERIFLRSPLKDQPKTIQFEDAKDNDKLSKKVIDNAEGLQWGTSIVDAISDVPQGEKKVGEYFAPVILETIPNAPQSTNVIPQLYKTDDTEVERKTFKHKPRIGYKVNSSFGAGNIAYIGNNITPFTDYATLSNYNSLPIVSGTTKNLHWNDTLYTPTFSATTGSVTAYDEYWNTYVNQLYNDGNKIIRADIYFQPHELRDIKLNDAIFVEDQYYRINKISGYNVNYGDVVSVELISLAQGELPTVELNCNFDFVYNAPTDKTTLIPPIQPTTSTTSTTSTTTTASPEGVVLYVTNQFTESINRTRVVFESNPPELFQYLNVPALSNVSTSSLQSLVTGSGGTNDIYVSWRLAETGSEKDLKLYSYNASINIDGSFAGSKGGSYYTNVTQSIDELIYSNANIRSFDSYSINLSLRPYTGTSYIRNLKLDYDNNTEFDVKYSRIKISDNPDNLFKINNIAGNTQVISSSNEILITPLTINSLTSDFEFDYAGLIDFDFTASLNKDGSLFNILSGSAFLSQSNQYSVLLDGALDLSANISYSVDWEINSGSSTTYLYYTNVGLSGSFPNFERVGNSRANVCQTSLISNDDFAFTTESLAVGVQLYNNPTFTQNFQFTTRSESSLFSNYNWVKIARPYSSPPYTGSSYRIDENGIIVDEWPCGYIWVPFRYQQQSLDPVGDQFEFNFTTPYNQVYSGIAAQSGSVIAEDFNRITTNQERQQYFVSLVDTETLWSANYGTFSELIGSASNENVFESRIILNQANKIQSTLDGYIHSGSIDRIPTFKMISDLTGSSQAVSAFDRYLINDERLTYLPDSSSLQAAHISPNDYFFSQINQYDRGQTPDFSGRKNTVGTLNYNTVYVARATVDSVTNSIYINNNASSDSNNRGNIYLDVNNQFNVKSMVIVYDKQAMGTTGPSGFLFDFRDMTGTLNGDNNYGYLRANTIDTQSGSLWQSGSYYVFDEASDTHTNVGETNVSNLIGTGSTQYPGPGGLTSDYTKRVFTFNFNPNRTFTANLFNSGGRMYIGSNYDQRGGMRGRIYGVFLYDRALTFEEHKSITNLMIDKGFISGSIV